MKTVNYNT